MKKACRPSAELSIEAHRVLKREPFVEVASVEKRLYFQPLRRKIIFVLV